MLCYLVVLLLEQRYVVITGTRLAWAVGIAVNVLLLILTVYRVCKMILPGAILWGISMVIFFFVFKIIFPEGEAAEK